jgi:hypothetical protein
VSGLEVRDRCVARVALESVAGGQGGQVEDVFRRKSGASTAFLSFSSLPRGFTYEGTSLYDGRNEKRRKEENQPQDHWVTPASDPLNVF